MVNFVKPNLLGTMKEFRNRFENPIRNGQHSDSMPHDVRLMKQRAHILNKLLKGSVDVSMGVWWPVWLSGLGLVVRESKVPGSNPEVGRSFFSFQSFNNQFCAMYYVMNGVLYHV